jgi:hypothetical protein
MPMAAARLGLCLLAGCGAEVPPPNATQAPATSPSPALPTATRGPAPSPSLAGASCGEAREWSGVPPTILSYVAAWNAADAGAELDRHLAAAMAEDGSFVDPTLERRLVGPKAIADRIAAALEARARPRFELREWHPSDVHHGYAQVRWRLCGTSGVMHGDDVVQLDATGRIVRATRFFTTEGIEFARPVCQLPLGDWTGIPELARKWAATTVSDPARRSELVSEIFADDGSYVDPSDAEPIVGHAAIEERVAGMLWEGAFFEPSAWTGGDDHHDSMRLRWRLCDGAEPGLEGVDYVEIDPRGRMSRVIGFFPWP